MHEYMIFTVEVCLLLLMLVFLIIFIFTVCFFLDNKITLFYALIVCMSQVHTLHIVGLHVMIVGAKCQLSGDDDVSDDLLGDGLCDADRWFVPVITLYACSFVRVRNINKVKSWINST